MLRSELEKRARLALEQINDYERRTGKSFDIQKMSEVFPFLENNSDKEVFKALLMEELTKSDFILNRDHSTEQAYQLYLEGIKVSLEQNVAIPRPRVPDDIHDRTTDEQKEILYREYSKLPQHNRESVMNKSDQDLGFAIGKAMNLEKSDTESIANYVNRVSQQFQALLPDAQKITFMNALEGESTRKQLAKSLKSFTRDVEDQKKSFELHIDKKSLYRRLTEQFAQENKVDFRGKSNQDILEKIRSMPRIEMYSKTTVDNPRLQRMKEILEQRKKEAFGLGTTTQRSTSNPDLTNLKNTQVLSSSPSLPELPSLKNVAAKDIMRHKEGSKLARPPARRAKSEEADQRIGSKELQTFTRKIGDTVKNAPDPNLPPTVSTPQLPQKRSSRLEKRGAQKFDRSEIQKELEQFKSNPDNDPLSR